MHVVDSTAFGLARGGRRFPAPRSGCDRSKRQTSCPKLKKLLRLLIMKLGSCYTVVAEMEPIQVSGLWFDGSKRCLSIDGFTFDADDLSLGRQVRGIGCTAGFRTGQCHSHPSRTTRGPGMLLGEGVARRSSTTARNGWSRSTGQLCTGGGKA